MAKLKNPLLAFGAVGRLGKGIALRRSGSLDIAEKKPETPNLKTLAQLEWRHMYQKAVALWNALSGAEKQDWESLARRQHMTGFAYFISQALKPNPGLYLPLQGGTMSGDIAMSTKRVTGLSDPALAQDSDTKAARDAAIAAALYTQGARVYHSLDQLIPTATTTVLSFNSERYDTDNIHSTVANNSRLTCKTAGKYIIVANVRWASGTASARAVYIKLNGTTWIGMVQMRLAATDIMFMITDTIYNLAVNDYVEVYVEQYTGGNLNVQAAANYSPEFMMQRIG